MALRGAVDVQLLEDRVRVRRGGQGDEGEQRREHVCGSKETAKLLPNGGRGRAAFMCPSPERVRQLLHLEKEEIMIHSNIQVRHNLEVIAAPEICRDTQLAHGHQHWQNTGVVWVNAQL